MELFRTFQPIEEAVMRNHVSVVECLLSQEGFASHLGNLNSRGENILHLASGPCNPKMFRLLVSHWQEVIDQTDSQGNTALTRIIKSSSNSQNRYESLRILFAYTNENKISIGHHNPLQVDRVKSVSNLTTDFVTSESTSTLEKCKCTLSINLSPSIVYLAEKTHQQVPGLTSLMDQAGGL